MLTIHVDHVSKRFRLGSGSDYGRITEAIAGALKSVFRTPRPVWNSDLSAAATGEVSRVRDGWFWALDDLDLRVDQGEIVGVVGRNGAGKSTLLKLLSRIISPTSGRVGVRGRVGSLLEVGTGFHPELTGRENIFLNGSILGMSRKDIVSRFDEIVSFAEVDQFLNTPVKRYSSGMAVRLAFSVAAHFEPDVLIIDEVLAVGDQSFQQKCMDKAKELGQQGRTVLLVSHNLASVATLCTRAVYLREGKLVQDGAPASVIEHYLRTSTGVGGARNWTPDTAPRSKNWMLHSVDIRSGSEHSPTSSEVDIDKPIHISIEYEVLRDGIKTTPSIRLKDESFCQVLWSTNAHSMNLERDPLFGEPLTKGRYRALCTIPANFLNDSRYFVSVGLGEAAGDKDIEQESALSFLVHDTGVMRREFIGNWAGPLVRPRLAWRSNVCNS